MFFISEKSNALIGGPITMFRPPLPKVFAAGICQAGCWSAAQFERVPLARIVHVLNQAPVPGFEIRQSPMRFGRSDPEAVLLLSPLIVGVNGRPACRVRIPPICQPPR